MFWWRSSEDDQNRNSNEEIGHISYKVENLFRHKNSLGTTGLPEEPLGKEGGTKLMEFYT